MELGRKALELAASDGWVHGKVMRITQCVPQSGDPRLDQLRVAIAYYLHYLLTDGADASTVRYLMMVIGYKLPESDFVSVLIEMEKSKILRCIVSLPCDKWEVSQDFRDKMTNLRPRRSTNG